MSGSNQMHPLAERRYVRLTTFRRDGEPVHTTVWQVFVDGALYIHTGDQTGKAKRLRANGRAELASSDGRGRIKGEPIEATGTTLNGENPRHLESAFRDKYGWQYRAVRMTERPRRKTIGEPTFFRFEIDQDDG